MEILEAPSQGGRAVSQVFHEHLGNLSLWEQIDKFFNPGKYSCTALAPVVPGWLIMVLIGVCLAIGLILFFHYTGREVDSLETLDYTEPGETMEK